MKIAIIGTGYVGLVTGACLADFGNTVTCLDRDPMKIGALSAGRLPIYEPGLDALVARNARDGRLKLGIIEEGESLTVDDAYVTISTADVIVIAVGTPQAKGSHAPNIDAIAAVARLIGRALRFADASHNPVIMTKSTVPIGSADAIRSIVSEYAAPRASDTFSVISCPEFLKEGTAVEDFMRPSRIVVGVEPDDDRARAVVTSLFTPLVRERSQIIFMSPRSAELTKYAANGLLATRISFMNELALLADATKANIDDVRLGIGSDPRIGSAFLYAGVGYGGSCLLGHETVLIRKDGETKLVRMDTLPAVPFDVLAHPIGKVSPVFAPVSGWTERFYDGDVYTVRTKMGRIVQATADHPFVVHDGEGSETRTVLARDLTPESWLPIAIGEPEGRVVEERVFDLLPFAPSPDLVIVRAPAEVAARLDDLRALVPRGRLADIKRSGTLRLHEAQAAGLDLSRATISTCRNGTYVPTQIKETPAFWYMIGLYISEGWITTDGAHERHRIGWSFHPTDEEHYVEAVTKFWGQYETKTQTYSHETSRVVHLSSKIIARWFREGLGLGKSSYDQIIPDAAWTASPACQRALMRGLWHGDGGWSHTTGDVGAVLEYGTVSKPLADGVLRMLANMGIVARIATQRAAKATVDAYHITISGAPQIEACIDLVDPKDASDVRAAVARQTKRIAPTGYRDPTPSASLRVRVSDITHTPYRGPVYSLEVPGIHTFVTTGGLTVHNCFPKDLRALMYSASEANVKLSVVEAADKANERQKRVLADKILAYLNGSGGRVAIWGLAFKPGTDDIREAPALVLAEKLVEQGIEVVAFDPVAMPNVRQHAIAASPRFKLASDPYEAAASAHAIALVTEWHEFRHPDYGRLKEIMGPATSRPAIFDGRNALDARAARAAGFHYAGIGRP